MHSEYVVDFLPYLLVEPAFWHNLYAIFFVRDIDMLNSSPKMYRKFSIRDIFLLRIVASKPKDERYGKQ
jgi:hypothetical protein